MDQRRRLGVTLVLDGRRVASETRYGEAGVDVLTLYRAFAWSTAVTGFAGVTPSGLAELVASVRENGLLEPVVVAPNDDQRRRS